MLKAMQTMLVVLLNIVLYGMIVFGAVVLFHAGYSFANTTVSDTSKDLPPGKDAKFVVAEKESEYQLATRLAEANLVCDRYSFYLRVQLEKSKGDRLQKGTYLLNSSMTYEDIYHTIYQKE